MVLRQFVHGLQDGDLQKQLIPLHESLTPSQALDKVRDAKQTRETLSNVRGERLDSMHAVKSLPRGYRWPPRDGGGQQHSASKEPSRKSSGAQAVGGRAAMSEFSRGPGRQMKRAPLLVQCFRCAERGHRCDRCPKDPLALKCSGRQQRGYFLEVCGRLLELEKRSAAAVARTASRDHASCVGWSTTSGRGRRGLRHL
ncbi:---NA---, partial [Olea europaea subsp. europaea]